MKGMKKTDFEALAEVIASARTQANFGTNAVLDVIARGIADYACERYPRFKRGKFLQQCGVIQ